MLRKIIKYVFIVSFLTLFIIAGWFFIQWRQFLSTPINDTKTTVEFELKPGTPLYDLAEQLYHKKYISHPRWLIWLGRYEGVATKLQAGEYEITPGMLPREFLLKLVLGDVLLRRFTIIEGWTFDEMLTAMRANPYLKHTLNGLSDAQVMTALGHPDMNGEGRFFPDTYLFAKGTPDKTILAKAFKRMKNTLTKQWGLRAKKLPYKNAYQALIAASLIERETAVISERPLISGVIARRLIIRMPLQIDPTIVYALGKKYNGQLTVADLRVKSPYNTYIHYGLPPTPIGIPSLSSIKAALHPAINHYLYFVAKGDGSHVFSVTLREHDKAIRRYLLNNKSKKTKPVPFDLFEIMTESPLDFINPTGPIYHEKK